MGLSSSKSKSKTTPVVLEPMKTNLDNYAGNVADFLGKDPYGFVAPAAQLQTQAFGSAGNLGHGRTAVDDAIGMARNLPTISSSAPSAQQAAAQKAAVQQAGSQGYRYIAPADPSLIDPYHVEPMQHAQAASVLDGFNRYLDPALQQLVDATLAQYDDQSGWQAAALKAQAARSGAFGGSRGALAESQFQADSGRNRAQTAYSLRSDAWNKALNAAATDAGFRQQAGLFNAGADNDRTVNQAGIDMQRMLANAGIRNDWALNDSNQRTAAERFAAEAANARSMFNSAQANEIAQSNARLANEMAQFNVGQGNEMAQYAASNDLAAQRARAEQALVAAGLVGQLGQAQDANARADLGLVADLGQVQREIEQARLNAPLTQLQAGGALYGSIPDASYIGQVTNNKSSPSLGSMLGQAASTAALAFSERRLKRDIKPVGNHRGVGIYKFNYIWDEPAAPCRVGVMADEVETVIPEALGPIVAGYRTVNYDRIWR